MRTDLFTNSLSSCRESVEMLEDFKRQQRDNEEDLRSLHHRKLDMIHESVRATIRLISML